MTPYYDDGTCVIYHGDGLEWLEAHQGLASIVTDPPYGSRVDYGGVFDDRRSDYWEWMAGAVTTMRAAARVVTFTHRVPALRHLTGWDWVGVWSKPLQMSGLYWLPILPHWEPIFMYGIGGRGLRDLPRHFDVLTVHTADNARSDHPCPKPVPLMRSLVDWCEPGLVVDPFMGSGTTLRAAKDAGRPAIGIELNERYCEIAARRLGQEVLAL